MVPIATIAARDGISRQAVSKQVQRLRGAGLEVETDHNGRVVAVNMVHYDRLRSRFDDPSKAQSQSRSVALVDDGADNESLAEAQRQQTWLKVELLRLQREETEGSLVRKTDLDASLAELGSVIVRIIDGLPNAADDLALAVARDGTDGLRRGLKSLARRMREDVAAAIEAELVMRARTADQEPAAA